MHAQVTGAGIYTYVYYVNSDSDPFLPLSETIFGEEIMPSTLSISYGASEEALGADYLNRCNAEFGKLALAGVTILASSGDSGVVGADSDGECYDDLFDPQFPASSIYVTAVGGTEGGDTRETAWFYSGGGFSRYFDRPEWQIEAIEAYLNISEGTLPNLERFDPMKAAYPDISAQSVDYIVVIGGNYYSVSGTSASCPTVAGMISSINYARSEAGKAPLGLLNPILYELSSGPPSDDDDPSESPFNDIVEGCNEGCEIDGGIGFCSANGWDPVTGYGTPDYAKLYEALLAYA